ncbi:MAG: TonB family protein [Caulobacteraceae bacterium]|nr:TonB family protein [Caulobacteraceae bacterium]
MAGPEILALALVLSAVLAAAALGLMTLFEWRPSDPALREKGWALALYLPVLPIVLVGLALLLPPSAAPLRPTLQAPAAPTTLVVDLVFHRGLPGLQPGAVAGAVLALAGLLCAARTGRLAVRTVRLRRFLRSTRAAPDEVIAAVEAVARRTAAPTPGVRISDKGPEAMIAGLLRPVLILPAALVGGPALEAVCAHELAHLRRGDHRALWAEEVLLTLMAFNPVLGLIRDRRAAAREEACDAVALSHAGEAVRRLYARSLIDALRVPSPNGAAPALTFTSSRRILVMRRLKAILSPVPRSGARHRLTVLGAGVTLAVVAGASSFALAGQREPEVPRQAAATPAALAQLSAQPAARSVVAVPSVPAVSPRAVAIAAAAPRPKVEPVPVVAPAPAETPEAPITSPSWVQSPQASWPRAASTELTSGSAVVSCTARADGRLSDCAVVSEEPVGAGFGPAAVEAAGNARLAPSMVDAGATGRRIQFTVRFRLG